MRPSLVSALMLALALPLAAQQQTTPESLVQAAQAQNASLNALIQGAAAARSLRNFTEAKALFDRAKTSILAERDGLINNLMLYELASGGGVNGAQRVFREARSVFAMEPQNIGTWVNTYPELLVGGELDEVVSRLTPDASDPRYRCACYSQRGWMHRIAGDMQRSAVLFDSVAMAADSSVPTNETAQARAQLVRNFARAGRRADAERVMQRALAVDRIDQLPSATQYNWAQAYAELRDIPRMIEVLERLIMRGDLVTVQLLEARVSWDIVRQEPAFQQLLARHRGM